MKPHPTHWVYRPRSGDRVFRENWNTQAMACVCYEDGLRHILGGVAIGHSTAMPGGWWRDLARTTAAAVVQATGGVAVDCQGEVYVITPDPARAIAAFAFVRPPAPEDNSEVSRRIREAYREDDARNLRAVIAAGAPVRLDGDLPVADRAAEWVHPKIERIQAGKVALSDREGNRRVRFAVRAEYSDGGYAEAVAPWPGAVLWAPREYEAPTLYRWADLLVGLADVAARPACAGCRQDLRIGIGGNREFYPVAIAGHHWGDPFLAQWAPVCADCRESLLADAEIRNIGRAAGCPECRRLVAPSAAVDGRCPECAAANAR